MNVDMRIDEARQDELSRRLDELSCRRHMEIIADAADRLILDEHIASRARLRSDDFSALDQKPHAIVLHDSTRGVANLALVNVNSDPFTIGLHRFPVFGYPA